VTHSYLQLRKIVFSGPAKQAGLGLAPGVNVICGASDTGKSFLAESIDFMLGGSTLREIPERTAYGGIALDLAVSNGENWRIHRATSGGNVTLKDLNAPGDPGAITLKQAHAHDQTDNLSGFLLDKIGLLGKRILRSSRKGTTQSLSFRNLARLIIVQEGEIQQAGSPFWGGQYTLKSAELATIKLLLTGVDDSNVVAAEEIELDNSQQLALLDELLGDLATEIADLEKGKMNSTSSLTTLRTRLRPSAKTSALRSGSSILSWPRGVTCTSIARRSRVGSMRSPSIWRASICFVSTMTSISQGWRLSRKADRSSRMSNRFRARSAVRRRASNTQRACVTVMSTGSCRLQLLKS
jgi:hypothetical protein